MKTLTNILALLIILVTLVVTRAADSATELFQKGLIAEEVNRDLDTAIRSYQAAIAQLDEQRKLAATAIYRLAECYRKQGKPELARPLYSRVVKEFPDQTDLARLSLEPSGLAPAKVSGATQPTVEVLDEEMKEIRRLTAILRDSPDLLNRPENGVTPLQRAVRDGQVRVVRFLIEQGAEVDRAINGLTPLHFAAAFGHKAIAEVLLDAKANVNSADPNGMTPLHLAARNGFPAVAATMLARTAKPNALSRSGNIFLPGNLPGKSGLVENLVGGTPLHWAAQEGHNSVVRLLLDKGADVNASDPSAETPLMRAARKSQLVIVEQLLTAGAEVNHLNSRSETALIMAIGKGDVSIVEALLAKGAEVNYADRDSYTPLAYAVGNGNTAIADVLLAKGANVNARSDAGDTPLMSALKKKNAEMVTLLLRWKPDIEIPDSEGSSALWRAAEWGMPDIVEALLKAGANPNAVAPQSGMTPIYLCLERHPKILELLLAHGARVDVVDKSWKSPLDYAEPSFDPKNPALLELKLAESAKLLRAAGANPDWRYANAITMGRKAGNERVIQFLRGTNDVNRYSLYEVLARFYVQMPEGSRATQRGGGGFGGGRARVRLNDPQLPFPDFHNVTIRNLATTNAALKVTLDLSNALETGDCSKDRLLDWGDLVEIPETDHAISESWNGLDQKIRDTLAKCVERRVDIMVKEQLTRVTLTPGAVREGVREGLNVSPAGADGRSICVTPTFAFGQVFKHLGQGRTSSDLTRVKVRRPAAGGQPAREWTLNATSANSESDLWLRDGDVIEVQDKE